MNTCFNINNYRICGGLLFLAACLLLLACGTQSRNKSEGTSDLVIKKNYGITTQPQKFQIPVPVTTSNKYLLIENPHINAIKVSDQTNSVIWKTGDHFPFESRPIENRFFVFPIGASTVADTLNLVLDKTGENLSFVLRLLDEKSYTHFLKVDNYLIGGIIGFYGLAILLSFTLFLFNRSYKFFFFLTYVFFSVWWILNDAGILFVNWWPTSTVWHQSSRGFFSSLTMVLFGLFLYQHSNALLGKGIKVVVKVLLVFYSAKWLLSFFVAAGYFPASLKLVTMYINSICLLLLFGGVIVYLLKHREALRKNKFEVFSIVTYCVFVIMLALRELGVSFLVFKTLHQLEVLFFFPVQCLFMSAHLYLTTKEERKAVEADLLQLKVQQQRTIEETVAQVEASEKKRIAQDLHDEIGGIFVALKYQSLLCKQRIKDGVTAADFNYFIELADEGIKRQHRIINELQTTLEQPSGLFNSLRNQISLLTKSSDLKIKFDFKANESHWPPFLKAQLYRIILELLTNTIKHAGATSVTLAIIENAQIQIVFSDNGVGFVHHKDLPGNGINNIKQRINALKGQYELVSNSKGTQYFITIPLANV